MSLTHLLLFHNPVFGKINFLNTSLAIDLVPTASAEYFLLLGTHGFLWVALQVVLLPPNLLMH
jgi:hypothetical protein